uniref:ADP-ribosyl cyclase/cyclic ADP-ribose hydrolase n=1 Tax=Quercus lobata TaxID=97700 RepID=A0A7N2MG43_QUELO
MEKLSSKFSSINENLIGINSMVEELIPSYVGFGKDIYMMGICGMGGLGKTTLASAIYDEYYDHFEGSSFIANVRERSEKGELHKLQQQLLDEILGRSNTKIYNVQVGVKEIKSSGLHHKKVLLVLDDVNHRDQLEKLAGKDDWFGSGSWIIITTIDELVLKQHRVLKIYKPNGLDDNDALTLFCLKAFNEEQPKEGYMQLTQKVVKYASGLPLALVTLGSFLVGRTVEEWQSAFDSLKNIKGDIHKILKISYDGLEEMWKEIFLDIACFFGWIYKDKVIEVLENCGLNARIGISVLVEKSLLTINGEWLTMHDLLQEMGKKIVCQESGGNLGKQSRLWLNEDLIDVLTNNKGTEAIQAINCRYWFGFQFCDGDFKLEDFSEGFSKMSNLRLLIINSSPNGQRHLTLPNSLRYLRWEGCPFKCLASSHKQRMEFQFVHLELRGCNLEYLCEGVMQSDNLKYMDLSYSKNLIRTPDFSGVPILEVLNLSSCSRLVDIHPSIGQLSRLRYLYLNDCDNLTDLPCMSSVMQSLTVLELSCCCKISSFPKFTGIMKSLSELSLSWTAIEKVEPSSIERLTTLAFLDLSHCTRLECLPGNMDNLTALAFLHLSHCTRLEYLPSNMDNLTALAFLDLSHCTRLEYLPSNMDNLKSLENVNFSQCSKLKSLPRLPSNVRHIEAKGFSFLNWSPEGVKLSIWSQPLSQWLPFDEGGSLVGFTKLFHFLRGLFFHKAVLGGYIIRSWSAVKEGFSINIKLPSNWYNSKWIGFALWASLPQLPRVVEVKDGITARLIAPGGMRRNHSAFGHSTTYINGICLLYLSRKVWFRTVGNDECSQITVIFENRNDNSSSSSFDDNSSSSSFENDNSSYSTEHIWGECGVSLIYKQGVVRVDELNETNAPRFIESFGEVSIYKLTGGDDDVHIVGDDGVRIVDDDDDVHKFRDDVHKFGDDDFDDDDI